MRRYTLLELYDCGRAVFELGFARIRLGTLEPNTILNQAYAGVPSVAGSSRAADELHARVGCAIGRMAKRVPWRSTCLVQALAAQRWLKANGIGSSLYLGVRKVPAEAVEAHAWLISGGAVVTGGDPDGFSLLLSPPIFDGLREGAALPPTARGN